MYLADPYSANLKYLSVRSADGAVSELWLSVTMKGAADFDCVSGLLILHCTNRALAAWAETGWLQATEGMKSSNDRSSCPECLRQPHAYILVRPDGPHKGIILTNSDQQVSPLMSLTWVSFCRKVQVTWWSSTSWGAPVKWLVWHNNASGPAP